MSMLRRSLCQAALSLRAVGRKPATGAKQCLSTARPTANDALKADLLKIQRLLEQNHQRIQTIESLSRRLDSKTGSLSESVQAMETQVARISAIERVAHSARQYLEENAGPLMNVVDRVVTTSRPFVNKYTVGTVLGVLVLVWQYRSRVYQRTSAEVADIASMTLRQESLRLTIQETLSTVANNPETLRTLTDLLQRLITDEKTVADIVQLLVHVLATPQVQKALLDLLQVVFEDPHLQQLSGEFLLKGLDMDPVRKMLEEQTQALVRQTVSDDSVQKATAAGLQRSVGYAFVPPFLLRNKPVEDSNKKSNAVDPEKQPPAQ